MKILLASSVIPFSKVGVPWFIDALAVLLTNAGHEVEKLTVPYSPRIPGALDQRLALRLIDVSSRSDMLIATGIPAYVLQHPRKVVWLHVRTGCAPEPSFTRPQGEALAAIKHADNQALREAWRVFATSRNVAHEWQSAGYIKSTTLYPALWPEPERRTETGASNLLYCDTSTSDSRYELALQSLTQTSEPVGLTIAVDPSRSDLIHDMGHLIAQFRLEDRVRLLPYDVSTTLLRDCLGLLYMPANEPCYSKVFVQAIHVHRCIITTTDSGAATELLGRDADGLIVPPEPSAIAMAMDLVFRERQFAARRAAAACAIISDLDIGASQMMERLLS